MIEDIHQEGEFELALEVYKKKQEPSCNFCTTRMSTALLSSNGWRSII